MNPEFSYLLSLLTPTGKKSAIAVRSGAEPMPWISTASTSTTDLSKRISRDQRHHDRWMGSELRTFLSSNQSIS